MGRYIAKRILISLATLFVLVTVVFILVRLMPGDPFASEKMTPQVRQNLERYYGFDKPIVEQYLTYLGRLVRGDLGYSMKYANVTVNEIIAKAFPYSADLGLRALAIAVSVGLTLGVVSALNRGRPADILCVVIAIVGTSIPDFIMGYVLQYFFGIRWGLLPIAQYKGFAYTILPAVGLGFYTLALVSRLMRSSMLEVIQQDYIKTARAKGASRFRIVRKHMVRNAILPIVTVLGPITASVLTGTFVIESIFAIPGMGKFYVSSVQSLDYTLVLGMTVFFGAFLVTANFVVDLLYGLVDPRIRVVGR